MPPCCAVKAARRPLRRRVRRPSKPRLLKCRRNCLPHRRHQSRMWTSRYRISEWNCDAAAASAAARRTGSAWTVTAQCASLANASLRQWASSMAASRRHGCCSCRPNCARSRFRRCRAATRRQTRAAAQPSPTRHGRHHDHRSRPSAAHHTPPRLRGCACSAAGAGQGDRRLNRQRALGQAANRMIGRAGVRPDRSSRPAAGRATPA